MNPSSKYSPILGGTNSRRICIKRGQTINCKSAIAGSTPADASENKKRCFQFQEAAFFYYGYGRSTIIGRIGQVASKTFRTELCFSCNSSQMLKLFFTPTACDVQVLPVSVLGHKETLAVHSDSKRGQFEFEKGRSTFRVRIWPSGSPGPAPTSS